MRFALRLFVFRSPRATCTSKRNQTKPCYVPLCFVSIPCVIATTLVIPPANATKRKRASYPSESANLQNQTQANVTSRAYQALTLRFLAIAKANTKDLAFVPEIATKHKVLSYRFVCCRHVVKTQATTNLFSYVNQRSKRKQSKPSETKRRYLSITQENEKTQRQSYVKRKSTRDVPSRAGAFPTSHTVHPPSPSDIPMPSLASPLALASLFTHAVPLPSLFWHPPLSTCLSACVVPFVLSAHPIPCMRNIRYPDY